MSHALGLAATKAAGLKAQFGTMGKPYNAGAAAAAGVEVALLAQAGFVSNPNALDGQLGFGETHGGAGDLSAFDEMGTRAMIGEISHKFHACCHGTHAMIEALREMDVNAAEVSQVKLHTHPRWLNVCDQPEPRTGLEAKFSYRLIAALVLSGHDTARLDTFHDDLAKDPALCALRDKVTVIGEVGVAETGAIVSVVAGGVADVRSTDISDPMSLDERQAKLMAKANALIGVRASGLQKAVLEEEVDVAALASLLCQTEHSEPSATPK